MIPAVVAVLALAITSPAQSHAWKVGEPLPDLRLPTIDGTRTVSLAELRGKKLLVFEFASW